MEVSNAVGVLRRLGAGALVCAVLSAGAVTAVQAPAAAHHAPSGCSYFVGKPGKSGSTIRGIVGANTCSINAFQLARERWYGWQQLDRATVSGRSNYASLSYNCAGQGTYTYFTFHEGHWNAASNSADFRTSC